MEMRTIHYVFAAALLLATGQLGAQSVLERQMTTRLTGFLMGDSASAFPTIKKANFSAHFSGNGTSGTPLTIVAGGITTTEILNGTILGADLNQMSATSGQVLYWNGSTWGPTSVGGLVAEPSQQVVYGTGTGIDSDTKYLRDASNNDVFLTGPDGNVALRTTDTTGVLSVFANESESKAKLSLSGDGKYQIKISRDTGTTIGSDFYFTRTLGPSGAGGGNDNQVFIMGFNTSHGGGLVDPAKPGASLRIEERYRNTTGEPFSYEFHLPDIRLVGGDSRRPLTGFFSRDPAQMAGNWSFTTDHINVNDYASNTQRVTWGFATNGTYPKGIRFLDTAGITFAVNNLHMLAQRNAANSAYINVIKVDNSNRIYIGGGGESRTAIYNELQLTNTGLIWNEANSITVGQSGSASSSLLTTYGALDIITPGANRVFFLSSGNLQDWSVAGTQIGFVRNDGYLFFNNFSAKDLSSFNITHQSTAFSNPGLNLNGNSGVYWGDPHWYSTKDIGLSRVSSGVLRVNNGTSGAAAKIEVNTARIEASVGMATSIMGRDASGDVSAVSLGSGLSISGGILSPTLTGSGASGRATFWTGTNTISSDGSFLWDNTSKYLGIGVSPTSALHVSGGDNLTVTAQSSNSVGTTFQVKNTAVGGGDYTFSVSGPSNFYPAGSFIGYDIVASATRYWIDPSGNFGITAANTLPSKLYVTGSGSSSATYALIVTNSAGISTTAPLVIRNDELVGIGTNAPTCKLHVAGDVRITDLITDTPTQIVGADADGDLGVISFGSGISFSGGTLSATGTGGTVTSVGLSMPSIFSVSGSPVTGSGTLTATLASQSANRVFASPDGSAGAPTFRALVVADLPTLASTNISDFTEATQDVVGAFTVAGSGISATYSDAGNTLTIANTGDLSTTNELQTYAHSGTASYTNTLSNSGGAFTLQAGGINAISHTAGTVTITATEVDGSTTNEGSLTVGAGTATTSLIQSNTSGSTNVTLQAGGIVSLSEASNTITVSATEVDGSTSNELQTYAHSGTTSYTNTLSNSGGSFTIQAGGINAISHSAGTLTITATEVDGSVTNEGSLTVGAGTATTSLINSNTSGSTAVTLQAGGIVSLSEASNTITVSATEVDGSTSNELQTYAHSGTTSYTNTLSNSGGSFTIQAGGINAISHSAGTLTITATEVDGSTSNELQTLSFGSSTLSLSNGGGSVSQDNLNYWKSVTGPILHSNNNRVAVNATSGNGVFMVSGSQNSVMMEMQGSGLGDITLISASASNASGGWTAYNFSGAAIGGNAYSLLANTSNTANSNVISQLQVGGAGAGDPVVQWSVSGVGTWAGGVDNSESDKWKLSYNSTPGTNDAIVVTTGRQVALGAVTSPTYTHVADLDVVGTLGIAMPSGTTAQRPAGTGTPYIRHNSTKSLVEVQMGAQYYRIAADVTPSVSAGSAAGTGASISVSGNDQGGSVTLTTGSSGLGTGTLFTLTYGAAYEITSSGAKPIVAPGNSASATEVTKYFVNGTGNTSFTVNAGTALTASTVYVFRYVVTQ